jgi:hypothetical protein
VGVRFVATPLPVVLGRVEICPRVSHAYVCADGKLSGGASAIREGSGPVVEYVGLTMGWGGYALY